MGVACFQYLRLAIDLSVGLFGYDMGVTEKFTPTLHAHYQWTKGVECH